MANECLTHNCTNWAISEFAYCKEYEGAVACNARNHGFGANNQINMVFMEKILDNKF